MRIIPLTMAVLPLASSVAQSSVIQCPSLYSSENPKLKTRSLRPASFERKNYCRASSDFRFRLSLRNISPLNKFSGFESISVTRGAYGLRIRGAPHIFRLKLKDSSPKVLEGVKASGTSPAFEEEEEEEEEKIEPVKEGASSESGPVPFKTVEDSEPRGDSQVRGGEIEGKLEGGGVAGGGEGNFGGSGGSGAGKGGGEGSQGSGGGEESKEKAAQMSMSQKFTLAYAALLGVGGVVGYIKSGSSKSLVSGTLSALLLYYVHTQLPANPIFASSVGLGISAALLIVMGSRFKRSGKIFPAGVVSLVSLIMTGGYLHGILRSSHA